MANEKILLDIAVLENIYLMNRMNKEMKLFFPLKQFFVQRFLLRSGLVQLGLDLLQTSRGRHAVRELLDDLRQRVILQTISSDFLCPF